MFSFLASLFVLLLHGSSARDRYRPGSFYGFGRDSCSRLVPSIENVYLHRGDHSTAIDCYRRALELAREINDPVNIRKWSHNLRLANVRLRQSVDRLDSSRSA